MPSLIVANVSLLYAHLPVSERFAAAAAAGFDLVESWWPFDTPAPGGNEVDEFLRALDASGVRLVGLNLYAGNMPAGERGVLSHPGRESDLEQSLPATRRIADHTGCTLFNALYGLRVDGVSDEEALEIALGNLALVQKALPGATLLLEPLSTAANGDVPLVSLADAERVRCRALERGIHSVGLLLDTFHLSSNGLDLEAELRGHAAAVAHVQVADDPGRGAPGTGSVDFDRLLRVLGEVGYGGRIAAEFAPGDHAVQASEIESALGKPGVFA